MVVDGKRNNTNENVSQLDISMKNGMGRHMTKGIDNL